MNVVETVEAVADAALNKKISAVGTLHCSFRTAFLVVWCAVCSDHFCRSNFYPERGIDLQNNEHAIYITKKFTQKYSEDLSTSKPNNSTLCIQIPEASRKIKVLNDVILIMTVEFQELCFNSTSYKKKGARDTARGCKSVWRHPTKC